ncbi:ABC transporter substrate-binding protein [Conexibacter sp. CPCC 206217]|uniref:substrate-binding periplasmic protein n=1 Tax=Conexibacter sp. CPCC 206217 TaxID=3064574 RepID=UPI0027254329|nr:transporter substrate-binding domain-containing protein [Conexibacter sp. CPCC 206217]MDO8209023.1 transporter substrate-binding domain-containing protein [Conexibacter sp. CPCC 206217]
MVTKGSSGRWPKLVLALVLAAVAAFALSACGSDDDSGSTAASTTAAPASTSASTTGSADTGLNPAQAGKLTVGMNLQFKPEMYLENGQPAGYDVELLRLLAPATGLDLNIQNLDFNGLIPGLQSRKFDMVSVGLSATPERRQVVDFSRAYVPYAQVLGVPAADAASVTSADQLNRSGETIVALQGSTAEQLARRMFPDATINGLPDQNSAFLEVATGRADGIVVEDYLLAQFQASNRGRLEKAQIDRPLDVQYGSYAVPKGNEAFVQFLDRFLCEKQQDGTLETLYKRAFSVTEMPPMPPC